MCDEDLELLYYFLASLFLLSPIWVIIYLILAYTQINK
jgi:hypothetical protein